MATRSPDWPSSFSVSVVREQPAANGMATMAAKSIREKCIRCHLIRPCGALVFIAPSIAKLNEDGQSRRLGMIRT